MVDDGRRQRITKGLLGLLGVSAVIGGVFAVVLFWAFGGGGDDPGPTVSENPSATDAPEDRATDAADGAASENGSTDGTTEDDSEDAEDDTDDTETDDSDGDDEGEDDDQEGAEPGEITLSANPTSVGSFEDVILSGAHPGADGTQLQVRRRLEGGDWEAFPGPLTTTVRDGEYSVRIRSGRSGPNEFRMRASGGDVSNVVTVTVGE